MYALARRFLIGLTLLGFLVLGAVLTNGSLNPFSEPGAPLTAGAGQPPSSLPRSPGKTAYSNPSSGSSPLSEPTRRQLRSLGFQLVEPRQPVSFSLPDTRNRPRSVKQFRGDVVVLNFWASWCPPCKEEMPSMQRLWEGSRNQGITVLAVNIRETPSTVRSFVETYELTFPVWLDSGSLSDRMRVSTLPTTWIIGARGRTLGRLVGAISWDRPVVKQVLTAIRDETQPAATR